MIQRIRDRQSFQRIRRDGTRIRRPNLWCIWCSSPESNGPRVAFVIGRAIGNAVTRNRLRRRIRAILHEFDHTEALPSCLLLIGANPGANELTFSDLKSELAALITQLRSACAP